jgi:hypothetical protein
MQQKDKGELISNTARKPTRTSYGTNVNYSKSLSLCRLITLCITEVDSKYYGIPERRRNSHGMKKEALQITRTASVDLFSARVSFKRFLVST